MVNEIEFGLDQLLILESMLTPSEVSLDKPEPLPLGVPIKELCLKIGSALVQAAKGQRVPLVLTETECWILRERVSIFTTVGTNQQEGLEIKLLLYKLLLEYAAEREVGTLLESDHEELSLQEVRNELARRNNPNTRKSAR